VQVCVILMFHERWSVLSLSGSTVMMLGEVKRWSGLLVVRPFWADLS